MAPIKELHYFDRSISYPSPNVLATTSPLRRMLGTAAWERARTLRGLKALMQTVRRKNWPRAAWLANWYFGYISDDWYGRLFSAGQGY